MAQQLSADRLQSQVQQLLTGLAEPRSGPDASVQQPAGDQDAMASPSWHHASSSAGQAGSEGCCVEQSATRLPRPLGEAEEVQGGPNSSAHGAAPSQQLVAAAGPAAAEVMRAEGVAQLPFPMAAALPPGWTVIHSQVKPSRHAAAIPFQLPPPRLPAHAQLPPAGQPGPGNLPCNVTDLPAQQDACQDIPSDRPHQDGRRRSATADLACREGLSLSEDTHSVDVGGPSYLQPLQQAAEPSAARTSHAAETASIDIVGSRALASAAAPAAECIQGSVSHADTASIDIIGPGTLMAAPQAADELDAAQAGQIQSGSDSAAGQGIAPASIPPDACGKHGADDVQQAKQAANQGAGRQPAAACAGKRPRGAQQDASSKQLKLQRTLRELDVDPSSSLTLSASEWLPALPAKTRQQALASQQLRQLRGRQIVTPAAASAAVCRTGQACSELSDAPSSPPGIAPAAHEQHLQACNASAGAPETAEAAPEHASKDREGVQQQAVAEHQASKVVNLQSDARPAQPAKQPAPPHKEPTKGSRELNSLLTSALATPEHQASSISLCRQSTGTTRAHSALLLGTSGAPVNKRKKASTGELARLLEAAAKVSPREACSAPLHLQAHGRTRSQSTPKHSTSDKPLSLSKDRKPNRELARLLHAAAEVPPRDASSAPLYLGATRAAKAQSRQTASLEVNAPAPVQAQAEAPPQPKAKPKPVRGLRELAALCNGLSVQAPIQPRRRHAVKLQQAETACQNPVLTPSMPAVARQADMRERSPAGSRERQWAASGQPIGQLGSRALHRQTRRAGQLAAVQGRGITKRTKQWDLSHVGHAPVASSGRQSSSKPHVKQTARKQTALHARRAFHDWRVAQGNKQPGRAVPPRKAGRAPAKGARVPAAAPGEAGQPAGALPPGHAVLKRRAFAVRSTAKEAHKGIARALAKGSHKHFGAAEGLSSVGSQGSGGPQAPGDHAARRSKRAAAGARLHQVLKQVKNPIQAARAELMQSRAAQRALLQRKLSGRAALAEQPLRPMPTEEAPTPSDGTACNWGASQRRSCEAFRGVQRLADAYKAPWNASRPSAGGKRPMHSVDSARPNKRPRSDQQPNHSEAQHRSAAAGPMPGLATDTAAELPAGSMPSMEQGGGIPPVHASGVPAVQSMQHGWSHPAPQADAHRLLRPQQEFTVIRPGNPEPLPRSPGAAAFRHAAYAASKGGAAAPRIAAAEAATSLLRERSRVVKRSKTQQAAPISVPGRPGQKAPAPGRPPLPKQMRQPAGPAPGMHVPAHVRSQPAGDRPHSKRTQAGQPSALPQAGAPRGATCKAAEPQTDAISPQGKASPAYICNSKQTNVHQLKMCCGSHRQYIKTAHDR